MLKSHHMVVRTRMAPSPTGEFHIGSMRTLMYNWAFARKSGGKFILRIEDTDRERYVKGSVERTLDAIKKYGFDWDEGPEVGGEHKPYVQSERLDIYKKFALELVEKKKAYYCFCTSERLEKLREEQRKEKRPVTKYDRHCLNLSKEEVDKNLNEGKPYVIRMKIPDDQIVEVEDLILGKMTFPSNDLDDQVLLKSDGFPTYHLGVVVDDHLMEITHILRGREWLASTPKHVLLYKAFAWKEPHFAHLPVLREVDSTKKMSKRLGDVAAVDFLKAGFLPEALDNFMMFLGWNPGTEKEIYTLDEFIKDFSIAKIQKSEMSAFDRQRLSWINGHYIRSFSDEKLLEVLDTWAKNYDVVLVGADRPKEFRIKVLALIKDRIRHLSEFDSLAGYFFEGVLPEKGSLISYTESAERVKEILESFSKIFTGIEKEKWTSTNIETISHSMLTEKKYTAKEAFMTLRIAVTASSATPVLVEILELLGKEEVLLRIEKAISALKK